MIKQRTVRIRTKNFTASPLRRTIFVPFYAVARLGSHTPTSLILPNKKVIECNTVDAINNSNNKLRMKECFSKANIPQADMYHGTFMEGIKPIKDKLGIDDNEYLLVGKAICGFQGRGMKLIHNDGELREWLRTHNPTNYFIERFYNFAREYRLHATQYEMFLSWRKLRKTDAEERWFFNSTNCNWVGEQHPMFDKPTNWDLLCKTACDTVTSVGLDIGAVDIRIQSREMGKNPQFIVCEVNSGPALGIEGVKSYKEQIKKILTKKHGS